MGELSTEIFERHQAELLGKSYQELKAYFDENIRLFGVRYNTGSQYEKEWNTWCTAWNHQQSKIEQLEKRETEITRLVQGLRNEFDLWADDGEEFDAIEAQIEQIEKTLRGECE